MLKNEYLVVDCENRCWYSGARAEPERVIDRVICRAGDFLTGPFEVPLRSWRGGQPDRSSSATDSRHDRALFPRLVLRCINTDCSNQILILQHFSGSTKWSSLILQNFANFLKIKFRKFCKISEKFPDSWKFCWNFTKFCKISAKFRKNWKLS